MSIIRRSKTLYLRKRVPRRYQPVEPREFVCVSLHTDSMQVATAKEPVIWADLIDAWEARLAGDTQDADARLAAAKNLAAARGFRFMRSPEVARLPMPELMRRLDEVATTSTPGNPDLMAADAALGVTPQPPLTVTSALEKFWSVARDKTRGKSADQIRRWENPRKKAVKNFVDVVGDKEIGEIATPDLFRFREWWLDRIDAENITPNSANKDFVHLLHMVKTVARAEDVTLSFNTQGLMLDEGEQRQRPAFSVEWIRDRILKPGALGALNTEARCIVLGMINTGYRPSEAQGMLPEHIRLDATVPHISIEPVGRTLKNPYSKRIIPLVGVSLEAFKECPQGFPRYRDNPTLSDTVNKFMRENKLLETPNHSLYGLRHSFEDRMLAAGIDERIRRDIFGHSLNRQRYGNGASLAQMRDLLLPLAL